ncbi:hypothetical protein AAFF_G00154680 [Aldrovandia affinis]|uniref:KASH domain-containing protein n=1 Tax=Aldrovandia affinis TaxID=143900 RepID=A0AAD7SZW8_9TELE|nr:hypothetical protein AAFF_G00154680 [Aldrovandia affinis]
MTLGEGEYLREYSSGFEGEWDYSDQSKGAFGVVPLQGAYGQSSKTSYRKGSDSEDSEEQVGGSPYRRGLTRRLKSKGDTGTEGLQFRPGPAGTMAVDVQHRLVGVEEAQSQGDFDVRRREFEAWLQGENTRLSRILSQKETLSAKELKSRQHTLKDLQSHLGWGQDQFQQLLWSQKSSGGQGCVEDQDLDELQYRWVLYKSKLKDVGDLKASLIHKDGDTQAEVPIRSGKQKHSGFLYRVCRVALPLQLLLLALLLLAFFLPMMDEGASCSLTNNFARSFNIMLRYHGPPPT